MSKCPFHISTRDILFTLIRAAFGNDAAILRCPFRPTDRDMLFELVQNSPFGAAANPPSAPANLAAEAGDATVHLEWDASAGATAYKVYRDGSLLATLGDVQAYDDDTVTNGVEYAYKVKASNSGGDSAFSNEVTATPELSVGGIVSVTIGSDGWYADIEMLGLDVGGTYDLGMGADNDPTTGTPKIALTVVSKGYTGDVLGTITRTVFGTVDMRFPFSSVLIAGSFGGGTFTQGETITQGTSGATAIILFDQSAGGILYAKLVTGSPDNSHTWTGGTSGATFTASATPVDITIAGSAQEWFDGTNTTVRVPLSDFIFIKDNAGAGNSGTAPVGSILAGFYTKSGTPNNASGAGFAVTNNSTAAYPKVVANWSRPGFQRVTGNFDLACVAFHGVSAWNGSSQISPGTHNIACVKFTAADAHSHTATTTVTAPSIDLTQGDAAPVVEHIGPMNVSTLTALDVLMCNFQAYPIVGDADSVLDTSTGTAQPTPLYGPITMLNDKSNTYGVTKVLVDPSGNDSTGVAYDSAVFDEDTATPCLTINGAFVKALAYNNANHSRNNLGAVEVVLAEGSYAWTGGSGGVGTTPETWVTVKKKSTGATANTLLTTDSGDKSVSGRTKLDGIKVACSTVSVFSDATALWFDRCNFADSSVATIYQGTVWWLTRCSSIVISNGLQPFSTANSPLALLRGCDLNGFNNTITGYTIIGNSKTDSGDMSIRDYANSGTALAVNFICAFNRLSTSVSSGPALSVGGGFDNAYGFAVVQNVFESKSNAVPALVLLGADGATLILDNGIFWNNVIVGQRTNAAYNDTGANAPSRKLWSIKNNLIGDWNIKSDTFGTPNAARIRNWSVLYGAGSAGNIFAENIAGSGASGDFLSEFPGLKSIQPAISGQPPHGATNVAGYLDFVSDLSWHTGGAAAGNGDYHLNGTSPAVDLQRDLLVPFDLDGDARTTTDAAGAYHYEP